MLMAWGGSPAAPVLLCFDDRLSLIEPGAKLIERHVLQIAVAEMQDTGCHGCEGAPVAEACSIAASKLRGKKSFAAAATSS